MAKFNNRQRQMQQERLDDPPPPNPSSGKENNGNHGRSMRQMLLSKLSFTGNQMDDDLPADNAALRPEDSRLNGPSNESLGLVLKSSSYKISTLIDSHFSYSKEDVLKIINGNAILAQFPKLNDQTNPSQLAQELKGILKQVYDDIDSLKYKCDEVERKYKEATLHSSKELQSSMNILFKLQQKMARLEEQQVEYERMKDDINKLKGRLSAKEKERRTLANELEKKNKKIDELNVQMEELTKLAGGTLEEAEQKNVDAKMARSLMSELNIMTEKHNSLKDEVLHLRKQVALGGDKKASSEEIQQYQKQIHQLEEKNQSLSVELASKYDESEASNRELSSLRQALTGLQDRLARLLSDPTGSQNSVALDLEKEQRIKAEQREERERIEKIAIQARLKAASEEWQRSMEEMESENMDLKRMIGELTDNKLLLERKLAKKLEDGPGDAPVVSVDNAQVLDLETRLIDALADSRRAHLALQELKGGGYFFRVCAVIWRSNSNSKSVKQDCFVNGGDFFSLKVSPPANHPNATSIQHKYIFDRVCTAAEDISPTAADFLQYGIDGHHACLLTYGQLNNTGHFRFADPKNNDFGIFPKLLVATIAKLQEVEKSGYRLDLQATFIKITEEEIEDLLVDPDHQVAHEVKKNPDGSIFVTNLKGMPLNLADEEQMESFSKLICDIRELDSEIQSHYLVTLHIFSTQLSTGKTADGRLYFVDLAGTNSTRDLRSLQCLSEVLSSISKRQPNVNYRNTKLTYILQPALSQQGKTLVVVGVDPTEEYFDNSVEALKFGNIACQCVGSSNAPLGAGSNDTRKSAKNLDIRKALGAKSAAGGKL